MPFGLNIINFNPENYYKKKLIHIIFVHTKADR